MQHFVKRPDHLEGMRFTGGRTRAEEIIQWIASHDVQAQYQEKGGEYNARGEKFEKEQVTISYPWMGVTQGAYVGEWVTFDPLSASFTFYTHGDFIKRYEEIEVVPEVVEPQPPVEEPTPVVPEPEAPVEENIPVVEEETPTPEPEVPVEEDIPVVEEETPTPEVADDTH